MKTEDLYQQALETAARIKAVRLKIIAMKERLAGVEYNLRLAEAKVERNLIKRVGSERNLAPTAMDRERIFVLARDADRNIVALRKQRDELQFSIEREKAELSYLQAVFSVFQSAMRMKEEEEKL